MLASSIIQGTPCPERAMQTTNLPTPPLAAAWAEILPPEVMLAELDRSHAASDASRPESPLSRLAAMRDRLSAHQARAFDLLASTRRITRDPPTNEALFALPDLATSTGMVQAGLRRAASFTAVAPVIREIGTLGARLTELDMPLLSLPTRTVLTAQVAAVRESIDLLKARAVEQALGGERFCPLALRETAFQDFISSQQVAIDALIAACGLDGQARRNALAVTLQRIGNAYLRQAGQLPAGIPAWEAFPMEALGPDARGFDLEKFKVGHATGSDQAPAGTAGVDQPPVSLAILDQSHSRSLLAHGWVGSAALIAIGIDDLVSATADPATCSPTTRLHAHGFETCSVAQQQAGAFLQKLLIELSYLEEKMYLSRSVNKDGSGLTAAADRSLQEGAYVGSLELGDSIVAPAPDAPGAGGRSQRLIALDILCALPITARHYRDKHGDSLIVDPGLRDWLHSPVYSRELMILFDPACRLQLAPMDRIAGQLRALPVFSGQRI